MKLWQRTMIALARSARAQSLIESMNAVRMLSQRFVGGSDAQSVVTTAKHLAHNKILTSLYYLGEYVDDEQLVTKNVTEIVQVCSLLAGHGLQIHVSVDPTQIGSMLSWTKCRENAEQLARLIGSLASPHRKFLMLDMEDYAVCGPTIELFHQLHSEGLPVAVTVQAYLHRTGEDLNRLISTSAAVRLVKGAFAESREHAWTKRKEITQRYLQLAEMLLLEGTSRTGVYPIFATHDDSLISAILERAKAAGWSADQFEFEMLYGVRPALQRSLVEEGYRLRLYVPFGEHWWPYSARRIGENPRNALLVARSVLGN
jgi:proline dehydrogenase